MKKKEDSAAIKGKKYHAILETIPYGYWLFDLEGRLLEVNEAYAQMSGYSQNELLEMSIWDLEANVSREEVLEHIRMICQKGYHQFDTRHRRKDGTIFDVAITASYLNIDGGQMVVFTRDITEKQRDKAALQRNKEELETRVLERTQELQRALDKIRESETALRSAYEKAEADRLVFEGLLEYIPAGIIITGGPPDFPILKISRYTQEMTARSAASLLGHKAGYHSQAWGVLLPDGKQPKTFQMPLYRACYKGEQVRNEEFFLQTLDGRLLMILVSAAPIRDNQNNIVGAISTWRDITERKQMEQSLKEYAWKITKAQEEERKRIAYELHDDTAQYLSIIKLQLDSLIGSGLIHSSEVLEKLKYLEKDAGRAVDEVRRYSHELRPTVLEHMGLIAALEQIAQDINKFKEVKVEVKVEGTEPDLSEETKLGIFRIAQEALNNCRKHAQAGRAVIHVKFLRDRLQMTVSDNGRGFEVEKTLNQASLRGSLGLTSMQERAKLIGADLKIDSKPDQGTTVFVSMNP